MLQLKGSAIWARLQWVRESYGENGLEQLKTDLSPAGRNLIHEEIDRTAWYNYPLFIELSTAIDRRWGTGDLSLNMEIGRFSCLRNMPRFYSMFIRWGSVDWVLKRASNLFSTLFSEGTFQALHEPGKPFADGVVEGIHPPHLALCYSITGFAMGCIELSGAKNVRGEILSCRTRGAETCRSRVHWDG